MYSGTIMPNWLMKRAQLTPNRIALRYKDQTWTFAQLNEEALEFAKQCGAIGINKNDHVALLLQNNIETVKMIFGLQYVGATIVFLNTRLTPAELVWQINDAKVDYFIYDSHNKGKVADIREISLSQETAFCASQDIFSATKIDVPLVPLMEEISLDDIHSIIYTSGTTGHPKGVLLSYGNHWWSAIGSSLNLGIHADDCWLAAVPFFHVSGLSILMRSVIYGMTILIHDSFDSEHANYSIQHEGVTIISVVSTMVSKMLDKLGTDTYPPTFRCMLAGGGPLPLHLLEQCRERGIPIFQTYGMTETASQIVTLGPEDMLRKLGSAGKPLFPAQIRIEKEGMQLQAGEIGEIVVKGPNVTQCYFLREEATKEAIKDGWLYTGDLGYLDDEGFLYVVDRRSDLIISGGENIYPAEIEEVLTSHPAIAEAGVVGIEDDNWGAVPVGFVTLKNGQSVTPNDLLDYCSSRLAKYKVPTMIHFIDHLPRNASNKLIRRKLIDYIPSLKK